MPVLQCTEENALLYKMVQAIGFLKVPLTESLEF